ncbi:hypothetical protein HDU92_004346 [Lobulomyces angularis]|nr:hypothetical protein HDU92_004346 [Lobulomyces angularis]
MITRNNINTPTNIESNVVKSSKNFTSTISFQVYRMVLVNFILPAIIFNTLMKFTTEIVALLLSGVPPFIESIVIIITKRRVDIVSSVVLFCTLVGVVVTVATKNPLLLLVKDSCLTAFFGAAFLISLLFPTNLIWIYYQNFQTTKEDLEKLDKEWLLPGVQRETKVICLVWGIGLIFESILRTLLNLFSKIELKILVNINIAFPPVFVALLGLWTYLYILYLEKKNPIDVITQ